MVKVLLSAVDCGLFSHQVCREVAPVEVAAAAGKEASATMGSKPGEAT